MNFEHLTTSNSNEVRGLERKFNYADSVSVEHVVECARKIADKINASQSVEEQRIFIVDLFSDNSIIDMMESFFVDYKEESETKQAVIASVKAIKLRIIRELEKFLSPGLYLFVVKNLEEGSNKIKIVADDKLQESFFKETNIIKHDVFTIPLRQSLERLTGAFDALPNSEEMPYVVKPQIINNPVERHSAISYIVSKHEIITVEQILNREDPKLSVRDVLKALTDSLRGAKFLSNNRLTLTDISSTVPGRNIAYHGGSSVGFQTGIYFSPEEQVAVIFLSNRSGDSGSKICESIFDLIKF